MKPAKIKKLLSMLLAATVLLSSLTLNAFAAAAEQQEGGTTGGLSQELQDVLDNTLNTIAEKVSAPSFGISGGEWSVLALARGGYYDTGDTYFLDYYDRVVKTVNETADENGKLSANQSTENTRLILALSAIGKSAEQVGNYNLIEPLSDFDWVVYQGINGAIYALLAMDTNNYQTSDPTTRQQCIDFILEKQQATSGGWALFGSSADPDITAMALQALAPYRDDEKVAAAIDRGINALSSIQRDDGGFGSWGSINSESISQVIIACTALGIDPGTDSRFVKNGNSAVDAQLLFYNEDTKDFSHVQGYGGNSMATDQAACALIAYQLFLQGEPSLYDILGDAKADAKNELNTYKDPAAYRDAQKVVLAQAIADGEAAIDAAENWDAVSTALAAAKKEIDAIKTDAQLTAEEEGDARALAKINAQKELDAYKNAADYRPAQQTELAEAIAAGKAAVEAANNVAEVNAALEKAKAAMDAIKTDAQLTEEENANQPEPETVTITDVNGTGAIATAEEGVLTDKMELEVNNLTSGDKYDVAQSAFADKGGAFQLFDIYLLENNVEIQPGGKITISLPVPQGYNAAAKVYHIREDGTLTDMGAALTDGKLVFTTDHLSLYAVWQPASVTDAGSSGEDNSQQDSQAGDTSSAVREAASSNADVDKAAGGPNTGEGDAVVLWLAVSMLSLAAMAVLLKSKKKQNQ